MPPHPIVGVEVTESLGWVVPLERPFVSDVLVVIHIEHDRIAAIMAALMEHLSKLVN
jgi:hypothetical protein